MPNSLTSDERKTALKLSQEVVDEVTGRKLVDKPLADQLRVLSDYIENNGLPLQRAAVDSVKTVEGSHANGFDLHFGYGAQMGDLLRLHRTLANATLFADRWGASGSGEDVAKLELRGELAGLPIEISIYPRGTELKALFETFPELLEAAPHRDVKLPIDRAYGAIRRANAKAKATS